MAILFSWDETKQNSNIRKHGVTFAEASSVFYDEDAVYLYDDNHSVDEDRFLVIGQSESSGILLVCHCYRKSGEEIRIISARKATKNERLLYGGA